MNRDQFSGLLAGVIVTLLTIPLILVLAAGPTTPKLIINTPETVPSGLGQNGFEAVVMVVNQGDQNVAFEATVYFSGMWSGHNPVRPLGGKVYWEECNLPGSENGCKIWWRGEIEPGKNAVLIVPVMYALGEGTMNL